MFKQHVDRRRILGVGLCALWVVAYVGDMAEPSEPPPALRQAPGSPIRVDGTPTAIAIADLDQDGNPDTVVAQRDGESLAVLLGDGRGAFPRQRQIDVTGALRGEHLACGDLDEDGTLDLVVGQHDASYDLILLFGDGRGGFARRAPPLRPLASSEPHNHGIALADLNGDRHLDIIALNAGGHRGKPDESITVLTGDGKGGFAPATGSPFSLGRMPPHLAVLDLNRDGTPDVATTHEASPDISVLLGDGQGGLRLAGRHPASGHSIAAADFNGDRWDDFAVTTGDGNSILLFFGDAGGSVRAAIQPIAVGAAAYRIAAGDFNGDRHPDLIVVSSGDTIALLHGDGTGGFHRVPGFPFGTGKSPVFLAVGNFNKDEKSDVAVTNRQSNDVSVFLGQ